MNVGDLKKLLNDVPDNLPVHVHDYEYSNVNKIPRVVRVERLPIRNVERLIFIFDSSIELSG